MTAQDSFYAEIATFYGAMFFNGLEGVVRTGGLETTPLSDQRADNELIAPNTEFYESFHFTDLCSKRALKHRVSATSDRVHWQTVPCSALSMGAWLKRHNPKIVKKALAESLLSLGVLPDSADERV